MKVNKKGTSLDFIFIVVFICIIALMIFLGKMLFDNLNTEIQSSNTLTNSSKTLIQEQNNRYVGIFDYGFLMLLVGWYIVFLVSAYFLDTSPVFFVLALIFTIIGFVLAGMMNNVFFDISSSSAFVSTANQFVIIPYVFDHLLPILVFFSISFMVIMYAKFK